MGLDTYAARSQNDGLIDADRKAFENAEISLCGGLLSGDAGSFRGKVYNDVVWRVTGVSLYEHWIPPETVRAMAEAFGRCDPEQVAQEAHWPPYVTSAEHVLELAKFFRVCADRGLGLWGWW
jgi:hypothetical protein